MAESAPADDGVMRRLVSAELPAIVDEVLAQPKILRSCEELKLDPADLRARLLAEPDVLLSPTNAEISAYRDAGRALGAVDASTPGTERTWVSDSRALFEFVLLLVAPATVLGAAALLAHTYGGGGSLLVKIVLTPAIVFGALLVYFGLLIGGMLVLDNSTIPARPGPWGTAKARRAARWLAFVVAVGVVVVVWPSFARFVSLPGAVAAAVLAFVGLCIAAFVCADDATAASKSTTRTVRAVQARLRADAAAALAQWRKAARLAVEPAVGRLISRLAAPSYDVVLTVRDDSGLATMASTDLAVETVATDRFRRVLGGLRAGAIGVAGPRGVGKTTLLEAHREGRLLPAGREHLLIRVDAPIGYEGRDFALHVYAAACQAVIGYKSTSRSVKQRIFGRRSRDEKLWLWLVGSAANRLENIRYLQTRTTGWSGKLTLPVVSADASATRSTAKARQPLTYPEIITELREFLAVVAEVLAAVHASAATTPLVVAIDELDKIASPEHAHRFVNELKALFGVPGCHFVLSVSEDALVSFERRGFAVRDAFDSAFDEIIRVDQLTLPESRKLLSSRLIGLAEPFVCFCHSFSGGLPRDLIRVARAMMDLAHAAPAPTLAQVCSALTGTAIEQAARLAQRELRPLGHVPAAVELIRLADGPWLAAQGTGELFSTVGRLAATPTEAAVQAGAVRLELATFLYFALTLREVFDDELTKDQIVKASAAAGPGSFETLARARQAFGDNMMQAWLLVEQFRAAWGLAVVDR
ncbi:hypothetical protein LWP59_33075 [Amycolatopsis acidiphila]|uniref:KAP NTPase domain-containing protein n=1 Tax=Amycolatopsis acidiphila TaxID=715473 RepID=A0A558A1P4_9PSEU|nr:hypothetical protein [Amycolatopsis acidiphila]TVT18181.1 hypothetical protein FNH06_28800 [Amycolatopsis acidiphila]UIJ58868.1 hypothetical protein LWP59_33075 [Amycolatopsis acidiphila]GHG72451.1 hypothetical protein GCM10017788_34970 [Amycolatopsis acidiphila]